MATLVAWWTQRNALRQLHRALLNDPPISFSTDGLVPDFYWVEHGLGYALVGTLPRESLIQIAPVVCDQT